MKTTNATNARKNLYRLINETSEAHEPIRITRNKNNATLTSEDDWRAVQETLYLISIPGMRESIKKDFGTSVSGMQRGTRLVNWKPVYTRQAQKDVKK